MGDSVKQLDRLTVGAIAVVVYAATNLLHEGIGHGGACLLVHGHPRTLTAILFDSSPIPDAHWKERVIASGGTIANLVGVALALPFTRRGPPSQRFAAWLCFAVNYLMAAGYLLFSGVGNLGDWAVVAEGLLPEPLWRGGEAAVGAALYFWVGPRILLPRVEPFLGRGDDRVARARTLMLLPYLAGGVLYVVAGIPNPVGFFLVLVSGAAASFGGGSLLAWVWRTVGKPRPETPEMALGIPRSAGWIAAAAIAAILFVGVFGPGVQLSPLGWPAAR